MHLYLLRHGIAENRDTWKGTDEDRPLTDKGRQRTRAVLVAVREEYEIHADAVWTGPFLRCRQTAEIAAGVLAAPLVECRQLAYGATVQKLVKAMRKQAAPDCLVLVGHEPDLGRMLAELLGEAGTRPFKKAGIACCTGKFRPGQMKLEWHLRPRDMLRDWQPDASE